MRNSIGGLVRWLAASVMLLATAASAEPVCKGRDLSIEPTVKPDFQAFANDLLNDDGLLWKVEKDGVAPSYLYGTIHSTQPEPIALAREAAKHIEDSKTVATELGGPFDATAKINMTSVMLSAALSVDKDTFVDVLTPEEISLVEGYLTAHGYPREMAHHLKLWFLAVASSLPSCETEGQTKGLPEVDDEIARIATAKGLPVIALETIEEQSEAVSSTPPELAARMLVATARSPNLDDDAYVTLLKLYAKKRPADAIAILDAAPGVDAEDRAAEKDFTKLLLVSRNEIMAERSAPMLRRGGAFIAVGALHLAGKEGLVERYRAMGYRVTKVW